MKPLRVVAWTLAVLALVGTAGCKRASGKPVVSFVTNNPDPFWNIVEAGAQKAAAEEDVELIFRKPEGSDVAAQKDAVEQVLSEGIKGIAISVVDPKNQNRYLTGVAKNVPFLAVDNDAPDSGRLAYVGTDNYRAGRAAGALVRKAMPAGGKVIIFVGSLESDNARARRQGVIDELAGKKKATIADDTKYGKYTYLKTYTDQPAGEARCEEQCTTALADFDDYSDVCLIGLWAYNPPAILSAARKVKGALGTVKIVAFDENPKTLDGIKKGHVVGTIVQQPYEFGYQSIKILAKVARDEKPKIPDDKLIHIPHYVVTKSGKDIKDGDGKKTKGREVEEFHKALNKLLGKD